MAEGHGLALHEELETSERSADAIRRDIAARRDSISGTVDRLGDRLHETFDWRSYVSDYPFVALGVAAGLGLALSGVVRRRPTPSERIFEAVSETVEDLTDRLRANVHEVAPKRKVARTGGFLSSGLAGLAVTVATELVKRQAREASVRETPARANRSIPASEDFSDRAETLDEPPVRSPWPQSGGRIVI